jgi:hypothetical protein
MVAPLMSWFPGRLHDLRLWSEMLFGQVSKRVARFRRSQGGLISVIINWLHFADHEVARFRRSRNGSISPISNNSVTAEQFLLKLFEFFFAFSFSRSGNLNSNNPLILVMYFICPTYFFFNSFVYLTYRHNLLITLALRRYSTTVINIQSNPHFISFSCLLACIFFMAFITQRH